MFSSAKRNEEGNENNWRNLLTPYKNSQGVAENKQ